MARPQFSIIEASGELVNGEHLTDATLLVLTELGIAHPSKPGTVTTTDKEPEPNQVPQPPRKYTRMIAVTNALKSAKKPLSKEEWVSRADKLYTDHGGKSNLNETKWSLNYVIAVLAGLDIAIETEKGFQLR